MATRETRTIQKRELLGTCRKSKHIWIYHFHQLPTPRFDENFAIIEPLNNTQNPLLIHGYIRLFEQYARNTLIIPYEIKHLLSVFYVTHTRYVMDNAFDSLGTICRCIERRTQTTFAVKRINKNILYRIHHIYRHRVLRAVRDELDILKTMSHPNIVQIKNVYEDKYTISIITEECKGGTLFDRIAQMKHFTEHQAATIMEQIFKALRYLHQEMAIVHCDITPHNIYFVNESDDLHIKIYGFGMSKLLPRLQYFTVLHQTPYYTSGDMIKHRRYNHACDMWSAGVILYIMLYGYPPFNVSREKYGKYETDALYTKIVRGFCPRIRSSKKYGLGPWFPHNIQRSVEVRDLITKLLTKQVRKRYTACEALLHPWIINMGQIKTTHHKHRSLRNLRKFNAVCNFKMSVINFFRDQFDTLRLKHFKEIEALCNEMDSDKDGIISYQQLVDIVSKVKGLVPHKVFRNECNISFKGLLNGLRHDYVVSHDLKLYDIFRKLDDDNDGKISVNELISAFTKHDTLKEQNRALQYIQDIASDSYIDYEEFLLHLHQNFEEAQLKIIFDEDKQ